MSTLLNEKQILIIPLLAKLREHNPNIGAYEKSILKDDFNYNVKVANGRIEIADELIDDFHRAPITITATRYRNAAMRFMPNTAQTAIPGLVVNPKRNGNWVFYTLAMILLVLIASALFQYTSEAESGSAILAKPPPKTPGELRQELLALEKSSPATYITIKQPSWRASFSGQIVLAGEIKNKATLATFKDVVLKVTFLSKTGAALRTNQYTIYEFVGPSKAIPYKLKVNGARDIADVKVEVAGGTAK